MKGRVSAPDDRGMSHEWALAHLLHREAKLAEKCSDLENRVRRKNLRIYGVAEGNDKSDMIGYVTELLRNSLELSEDLTIRIERAHRSLADKPRAEQASPRSTIVRFVDYYTKDVILQQAWKQQQIT